mgnify:CR=1 FL=1
MNEEKKNAEGDLVKEDKPELTEKAEVGKNKQSMNIIGENVGSVQEKKTSQSSYTQNIRPEQNIDEKVTKQRQDSKEIKKTSEKTGEEQNKIVSDNQNDKNVHLAGKIDMEKSNCNTDNVSRTHQEMKNFEWPGETSVYYFYIWHCCKNDEKKDNWLSGRFPFLASTMPLPPKEKLDKKFIKKEWAFKRLQYKKDIPLYFYYSEVFQPSFFDPQRIGHLRSLYFSYYPAYFSKVKVESSQTGTKGPLLKPENLNGIPFLDESQYIEYYEDWLKSRLEKLRENPLKNKACLDNLPSLLILQQILRFYLRTYGFLLWCMNYFCNYDNNIRLGYSSIGNKIHTNSFTIGLDIKKFMGVRSLIPISDEENTIKIGTYDLTVKDREIIPSFLGLGSFKGGFHLNNTTKDYKDEDFVIFDNSSSEQKNKQTDIFHDFYQLLREKIFAPVDDLLNQHKIKIHLGRFIQDEKIPLSLTDKLIDNKKIKGKKLYEQTVLTSGGSRKAKYLKNYLPSSEAIEFYNCFNKNFQKISKNNIFTNESPQAWNLIGYLTYNGELTQSTLAGRTLIDTFCPDAVPIADSRVSINEGVLPFALG